MPQTDIYFQPGTQSEKLQIKIKKFSDVPKTIHLRPCWRGFPIHG